MRMGLLLLAAAATLGAGTLSAPASAAGQYGDHHLNGYQRAELRHERDHRERFVRMHREQRELRHRYHHHHRYYRP